MDYSQLSDFEINKRVGIALGKELMPDDCQDFGLSGFPELMLRNGDFKDYCNDPADAWSIIVGSKINIRFGAEGMDCEAQFIQCGRESVEFYHENPLRAAMIVFLMMQDANHA